MNIFYSKYTKCRSVVLMEVVAFIADDGGCLMWKSGLFKPERK